MLAERPVCRSRAGDMQAGSCLCTPSPGAPGNLLLLGARLSENRAIRHAGYARRERRRRRALRQPLGQSGGRVPQRAARLQGGGEGAV